MWLMGITGSVDLEPRLGWSKWKDYLLSAFEGGLRGFVLGDTAARAARDLGVRAL